MKLSELHPDLTVDHLYFDCPKCGKHRLGILHLGPDSWVMKIEGTNWDTVTIAPSIRASNGAGGCEWHGHIINGEIITS